MADEDEIIEGAESEEVDLTEANTEEFWKGTATDDANGDNGAIGEDGEAEEVEGEAEADAPTEEAEPELPEKLRGKTAQEIAAMYQNLERFLGMSKEDRAAADVESGTEQATATEVVDAAAMTRQAPIAQARYNELLEMERAKLGMEGYTDAEVAEHLAERRDALSAQAWGHAQQQDSYLQQAIDARVNAVLGNLLPAEARQQVFANDVNAFFSAVPVEGVTADEVLKEIARANISAIEWQQADPSVKADFIDRATKQMFYIKATKQTAEAAPTKAKAPAQPAPTPIKGTASRGGNGQVVAGRMAQAFAGYLDAEDLKDLE